MKKKNLGKKICLFWSILLHWFLKYQFHSYHLLFDQFTLIHGTNIPGSYAILLFISSDFTSITSHIYNWALFLVWLQLFILSAVISALFSSSILAHTDLETLSFTVISFCLFILFMGFSRQEYWSGLPFPSPVDHILLELSTMTRLSWVAPHGTYYIVLLNETRLWSMWSVWLVFYNCYSLEGLMLKLKLQYFG